MEEPRRLGDYEILTELATGGVATVYAARHASDAGFERLVAIKRVHRHLLRDPDVFASLADEARISALVHHPNVVATHEVLDQKGELCLVQAYVEGVSLALLHKRAVARGALLPVDVVARVALDFLRGLHAAHEAVDLRGAPLAIVHRDVSPQNVLVGADGVSRLIDFGVARAEGRITETRGGILKGKLAYMAPEQIAEKDVDRRADLFAAGVVLFELLAGERPFDGVGDAESMARILAADPDLAKVEERSPSLAPVVARALAREPDARWPTAEALAEAIEAAQRPAADGAMRALVADLAGELLAERRESIREELGRAGEAVAEPGPQDSVPPSVPPSVPHLRDSRPDFVRTTGKGGSTGAAVVELPRRSSSLSAFVVVAAVGAAAVIAVWLAGSRPATGVDASAGPPEPPTTRSAAEPPISRSAPSQAASLAVTPPAATPPSTKPLVPPRPPASPPAASAAPSGPRERPLHENPYGP